MSSSRLLKMFTAATNQNNRAIECAENEGWPKNFIVIEKSYIDAPRYAKLSDAAQFISDSAYDSWPDRGVHPLATIHNVDVDLDHLEHMLPTWLEKLRDQSEFWPQFRALCDQLADRADLIDHPHIQQRITRMLTDNGISGSSGEQFDVNTQPRPAGNGLGKDVRNH